MATEVVAHGYAASTATGTTPTKDAFGTAAARSAEVGAASQALDAGAALANATLAPPHLIRLSAEQLAARGIGDPVRKPRWFWR